MDWILAHWTEIVAALTLVAATARIIVKLTPTPADDAWLAKALKALKDIGLHIDPKPPVGGSGGAAAILLALLLVPAVLAGCQAPQTVRDAQAWEEGAWKVYLANTAKIHNLTLSLYDLERTAARNQATAKAVDLARAKAVDGKLPVDDFAEAVKAVIEGRDAVDNQTAAVKAKVREAIEKNDAEAAKALRLRGRLTEWLDAGVDATAVPGLVSDTLKTIQMFRADPAKPAAAPAAPGP